jgi:putative endonuclease
MIRNKTGVWGEIFTARYLRDRGYKILTSNFVCRFGELDVVAEKYGIVSIVEVKTRNKNTPVSPMEAVDEGKRSRLEAAAKQFMVYAKLKSEMRFDVCEVLVDDNNKLHSINYIENAFQEGI